MHCEVKITCLLLLCTVQCILPSCSALCGEHATFVVGSNPPWGQYWAVLCLPCTVASWTLLPITVLCCAVLYFTVMYYMVLYCDVMCCTVLLCTLLYANVLYSRPVELCRVIVHGIVISYRSSDSTSFSLKHPPPLPPLSPPLFPTASSFTSSSFPPLPPLYPYSSSPSPIL